MQKQQNMLKISLLFKENTILQMIKSRILTTKNVKFLGYYFYLNLNIWGDFKFCISVPLTVLFQVLIANYV